GRGMDIVLGGNSEFLARTRLKSADHPDFTIELERAQKECKAEHAEVIAVGGLHILCTERHESRRIDNQLRGRSGR
ncbi:MAG: hypothetical protein JKX97_08205, partial [Candidatus Lindowbacteria bacterium]|nr:hypothetical protein [Candidatus Lindowbacteria bacterium]